MKFESFGRLLVVSALLKLMYLDVAFTENIVGKVLFIILAIKLAFWCINGEKKLKLN